MIHDMIKVYNVIHHGDDSLNFLNHGDDVDYV